MSGDYKKVLISIIIIAIVVVGGLWAYKQRTKLSPLEESVVAFLEKNVLSESDQIKISKALSALKEDSNNVSALTNIAKIRYDMGDLEGSLEFYLKVLEVRPTDTLILNNSGVIYRRLRNYEKSAETFLKSIEINPKQIHGYEELASIYENRLPERFLEVEQILLTGIEKNSDVTGYAPADFYIVLGFFYMKTENIDKATDNFETALTIMPENESAQEALNGIKKLKK